MTSAPALNEQAAADVLAAVASGVLPEVFWDHDDDACDCMFVRIGMWTNPYTSETLEVRMCCIWERLYDLFPAFVRRTPAYLDHNLNEWVATPWAWNGDGPMPRGLWYRQRARIEGISVAQARAKYAGQQPPQGRVTERADRELAAIDRKRWWQRWR